jgi:hypothetical protein
MTSRARLEQVEALLRELMTRDFEHDPANSGSLGRMLVHIVNIHRSVSLPADDHSNAAKRLGDFALTMDRLKARKPESAIRLARVAEVLRAAGAGLTGPPSVAVPGPASADSADSADSEQKSH